MKIIISSYSARLHNDLVSWLVFIFAIRRLLGAHQSAVTCTGLSSLPTHTYQSMSPRAAGAPAVWYTHRPDLVIVSRTLSRHTIIYYNVIIYTIIYYTKWYYVRCILYAGSPSTGRRSTGRLPADITPFSFAIYLSIIIIIIIIMQSCLNNIIARQRRAYTSIRVFVCVCNMQSVDSIDLGLFGSWGLPGEPTLTCTRIWIGNFM